MFASHDVYLKSVEIPGTTKKLPSYCFNQCKNLESIILNEGVETCEQNSFRNVNKLRTLKIPNTFNGYFDLAMENRATSSLRGNSRYDGMNIEQEKNETLCIFLKRDEKDFEFRIKRGACPIIRIENDQVIIYITDGPAIKMDCQTLKPGIYDINDGKLVALSNQNTKEDENNIQEIFKEAYKQIFEFDDFKKLPVKSKLKIKVIMYNLFLENYKITGKINNDFSAMEYMFNKAKKILIQEELNQSEVYQENFDKKR